MTVAGKFLVLSHRYLGIAISILLVTWFASGFVMMYAGGMPRLAPEERLMRTANLDLSATHLSLAEAAEKAGFEPSAGWSGGRVTLHTIMGRPAYRFAGEATVFADTGEVMEPIDQKAARTVAANFLTLPEGRVNFVRTLTEPDQWTIGQSRQMPQFKFAAEDGNSTEIYVQADTGEVSMLTTGNTRLLAWLGTIPHWLYFAELRKNPPLWYDIVVYTSGLACVLALLGLVLGVWKFRRPKPFTWTKAIPYAGWMRWHYITGMVFGVFTLTFAFSGLLSMEPFAWTQAQGLQVPRDAFTGGAVDLLAYAKPQSAAWSSVLGDRAIKQIEFTRIQDEPYYLVRREPDPAMAAAQRERLHQPYNVIGRNEPDRLLVDAKTMILRTEPFSAESLVARLKMALPDAPIAAQELLTEYDSYYYSRGSLTPLPVLRVKFADPMQTWVYVDPRMSEVLASIHRLNRLERWLYNGLHSLDFSFLYNSRPAWDIVMIVLLAGGLVSSVLGLFLGIGRIRRATTRSLGALARPAAGRPEPAE